MPGNLTARRNQMCTAAFSLSPAPLGSVHSSNRFVASVTKVRRRSNASGTVACAAGARRAVTVTFAPDGVNVPAQVGECLGDVAARGNVSLLITCSVGDCGSCEIEQVLQNGDRQIVRPCIMPVPEPEAGAGETVTYLTYPDFTF